MCFDNYSDWTADIATSSIAIVAKRRCDECGRDFRDAPMHHVHYQEHKECHRCGCGDCACDDADFGETADYWCCEDCHRFLAAVEAAELAEGCGVSEARPLPGELMEEMSNQGQGRKRYWQHALRMFPELSRSGYLGWLWRVTGG